MQPDPDDEAEAWRSIVENYGERADLGPEDLLGSEHAAAPFDAPADPEDDSTRAEPEEGYVPPPPPPLPRVARDRMLAWMGVFGAPVALLVILALRVSVPSYVAYLLVAAFVGGFAYLVFRMPRGPRDPWDDGAQL